MLSREQEKLAHLTTESETELEAVDTESPINSCAITKLDTTEVLQSESKRGVVRVDSKPTVHVGGAVIPARVTNNTYKLPAHYYSSLPKYEWKQFYFLQPIKSSLKPIVINPLTAKQINPLSQQRRNVGMFQGRLPEKLRLPPIEKMPRSFSRLSRKPPTTWQEIIGSQFPVDPPMSRLMSTRSPKKLLMPLATLPPRPPSPAEVLRMPEEPQVKHEDEPSKPKLQLPEPSIKVIKGMPMEIGDPSKVSIHS